MYSTKCTISTVDAKVLTQYYFTYYFPATTTTTTDPSTAAAGVTTLANAVAAVAADVGEVVLEQPLPLRRGAQQPVRPAPGFGVVVLRELAGGGEGLHPVDIRPPRALE